MAQVRWNWSRPVTPPAPDSGRTCHWQQGLFVLLLLLIPPRNFGTVGHHNRKVYRSPERVFVVLGRDKPRAKSYYLPPSTETPPAFVEALLDINNSFSDTKIKDLLVSRAS